MPLVGTASCLVLAFSLPFASVLWRAAVVAVGAAVYGLRSNRRADEVSAQMTNVQGSDRR